MEQNKKVKKGAQNKNYSKARNKNYDKVARSESCDRITSNDIAWYNKYPDLYNDVTRVPFNKIAGYEYFVGGNANPGSGTAASVGNERSVPGVMRIKYVPTVGISSDYTSAINKAFQSLWSAIYSKTTGILQFPQYILGLQIMAGQSIAQNLGFVKRALATSYLYVARNSNYPRMLLEAMGIYPDSVIGHQDELRIRVNDLIRSFNSLCIPDFIDSFKRHYSLCHNVWMDGSDVNSPTYVFTPHIYYIYSDLGAGNYPDDVDGKARAMAFTMPNSNTKVTLDDICDVIEDQIEALRSSHDFQSILGSLQRAFDSNAFIQLDEAKVDEYLVPVYDEIILNQIRNLTSIGTALPEVSKTLPSPTISLSSKEAPGFSWDITGDPVTNTIKFEPCVTKTSNCACYLDDFGVGRNVLRFEDRNAINPDNIMECTRLMTYIDGAEDVYDYKWNEGELQEDTTVLCHPIVTCGLEVVTECRMYWKQADGTITSSSISAVLTAPSSPMDGSAVLEVLANLSQFWYAPLVYIYNNGTTYGLPIGELDHWTFVDRDTLEGLHMAANLSVFRATSALSVKN